MQRLADNFSAFENLYTCSNKISQFLCRGTGFSEYNGVMVMCLVDSEARLLAMLGLLLTNRLILLLCLQWFDTVGWASGLTNELISES